MRSEEILQPDCDLLVSAIDQFTYEIRVELKISKRL